MSTSTRTSGSPPWLDKKKVEAWLRTHYSGIEVTEVENDESTAIGANYLSDIHRLVVRTKDGGAHRIIVKACIQEGPTAEIMKDSCIFKTEKNIYGSILPKIYDILREVMQGDIEHIAPRCFYACESFLVMENLTPAGFKLADCRVGLDLQHCLVVMRNLARFHAASVLLHQRDPESMKEFLVSFVQEPSTVQGWEKFYTVVGRRLAEDLDTWSEEWKKYADLLRRQLPCMMKRIQQSVQRNASGFNVLNHGDMWTNNMLFNGDASQVRFVDFQLSYYSSPAVDLQYFIVTSTSLEVRTNHTDRVLQEYHKTLCDTLTSLGYTKKLMTLEELRKEFDSRAYYGLAAMIAPYSNIVSDPGSGFSLDEAFKGEDLATLKFSEHYRTAAKWLLPYFERNGVFADYK